MAVTSSLKASLKLLVVVLLFSHEGARAFRVGGLRTSHRRRPSWATTLGATYAPYDASPSPDNDDAKPLLLVFPGIDGSGRIGVAQAATLAERFDVRVLIDIGVVLTLGPEDRSTHDELVRGALEVIGQNNKAVLVGESQGGVTALGVALTAPDAVEAIVVANPATSYASSAVAKIAPLLPSLLPKPAYESLGALVAPLFGKPGWYDGLLDGPVGSSSSSSASFLDRSRELAAALPPGALAWRESELVRRGADKVNAAIRKLSTSDDASTATTSPLSWSDKAVFVAGARDVVLPSEFECRRLSRALGGRVVVAPTGAHVLLDDLDLPSLLDLAGVGLPQAVPAKTHEQDTESNEEKTRRPQTLNVTKILTPESDVERAVRAASRLVSPVFFSTDAKTGRRRRGLSALPPLASYYYDTHGKRKKTRPVLFAGNHQLFGLDGPLIVEAILKEKRHLVPSLVYPPLLEDESPLAPLPYPIPGSAAMLRRFGARPAGARGLVEALKRDNCCLVFPGGAREVFKRRGEAYSLAWPVAPTLVRVAAKFDALIVPFSGVGGDEFFGEYLFDSDELLDLPVVSDFLKPRLARLPSFVPGDVFVPPVLAPRLRGPRRQYFLFGRPLDANDVDPNDDDAVARLYDSLQTAVQDGIADLLDARTRDRFDRDLAARLAYETLVAAQAPTFDFFDDPR